MKATGRALFGVALAAAAAFCYLPWWAKQPGFGELIWPLWCVILLGVATAGRAALRPPVGTLRADRLAAAVCFALAIGIGGLFGQVTDFESYRLPPADQARLVDGRALPDAVVIASDGASWSLAAEQRGGRLAGKKTVLVFFRGFW
ncbi:MAG: hypothetical protein EXS13_05135 [Planctomycetes bacterium]|nr:hypothetical protein [Planctomycetota bacterium]